MMPGFGGDAQRPDWQNVGKVHDWRNHISEEVAAMWQTFTPEQREALAAMGHVLKPVSRAYGNLQAVSWNPRTGVVDAASDPRGVGEARVVRPAR